MELAQSSCSAAAKSTRQSFSMLRSEHATLVGFDMLLDLSSFGKALASLDRAILRTQRNLTSHSYNAAVALLVFQTALSFRDAARALLGELERRNVE